VTATRTVSATTNSQKDAGMPGFLEPIWEIIFRIATWSALIFGALSIGSAFVSAWVGWEITDATQKDADRKIKAADERIADAQERAAKATERTAELELSLAREVAARQPRSISPEQRAAIVEMLKPDRIFKGPVLINPVMDGEAWQFAEQIADTLKAAGFEPKDVPQGDRMIGSNRTGAFIWIKDMKNQPRHGGPIFKAFAQVGIPLIGGEDSSVPDWDTVVIAISSHP
jgi:hypothetical protein